MKILHAVGARPNFMKVAPILAQLRKHPSVEQVLVHTGQHYDAKMPDVFSQDLGCPPPTSTWASARGRRAADRGHRPRAHPLRRQRDDRFPPGRAAARARESASTRSWRSAAGNTRSPRCTAPANVDEPAALLRLLSALAEIAAQLPVILPIHPRTRARLPSGFEARGLRLTEPFGYLDFLALTEGARLVLTDSGGIQEETTALGVPCLTMRENTERPVTVTEGTNQLVGTDPARVIPAAREVLAGRAKKGRLPDLWDGRAAERVAEVLVRFGRRE